MFLVFLITEKALLRRNQSTSKSSSSNIGESKKSAAVTPNPRIINNTVLRFTPLLSAHISVCIVLCDVAVIFSKR